MLAQILLKKVIEMLERDREKKLICMPTHVGEDDALHVVEQAYERGWSNSAYIRHLIKQDRKRHLDASYLMSEVVGESNERFDLYERNERKLKSPTAGTVEPNVQLTSEVNEQ